MAAPKQGLVWNQKRVSAFLEHIDDGVVIFREPATLALFKAYQDECCAKIPDYEPRTVAIYVLVDPLTQQVRYAGQTTQALSERLHGHIGDALRAIGRPVVGDAAKVKWLCSLLAQEQKPQIELLAMATADTANDVEVALISALWTVGADLVNVAQTPRVWCDRGDQRHLHDIDTAINHEAYILLRLLAGIRLGGDVELYLKWLIEDAVHDEIVRRLRGWERPATKEVSALVDEQGYALLQALATEERLPLDVLAGAMLGTGIDANQEWYAAHCKEAALSTSHEHEGVEVSQ